MINITPKNPVFFKQDSFFIQIIPKLVKCYVNKIAGRLCENKDINNLVK